MLPGVSPRGLQNQLTGMDEPNSEQSSFKSQWLSHQLHKKEADFTELSEINVLSVSWNVAGQKPTSDLTGESLRDFIDTSASPALVCLGLQEMDMSAEGVIFRESEAKSAPWEKLFLEALTPEAYSLIASKQLGGVFMAVYVHAKFKSMVTDLCIGTAITGILGIVANKGGVGIRFTVGDSSFCFLNAHFNAHQHNVETRNEDFRTITSQLLFYPADLQRPDQEPVPITIYDHDVIIWVGDFNYRIDLPDAFVRQRIELKDWQTLWAADQLFNQQKRGNCFVGWVEAPIDWAPTYKYDDGCNVYDSSKQHRVPAWTDRVLWYSKYVKNLSYRRHECFFSDHRPVSASFSVGMKTVAPEKKQKVVADITQHLELVAQKRPSARLSAVEIDFGNVKFGVPLVHTTTLTNDGESIIRWFFIPKLVETQISKSWISVSPHNGMLGPGEQATITFTCQVLRKAAPHCQADEILEDLVVLNIQNQIQERRDYFISFHGVYQRSVFGSSLASLVHQPYPIRQNKTCPTLKLKIPKELWRMCDWINTNGMDAHEIFIRKGKVSQLVVLRECFDTGKALPEDTDAHAMGETLLMFLNSLKDPLIPFDHYSAALSASKDFTQCKQLVGKFPEVNSNVFYYLTAFLRDVLLHAENKLDPQKLAFVFSKVFFKTPPAQRDPKGGKLTRAEQKAAFVLHFLLPANFAKVENPPTVAQ